jgi:hypothetical protein
MCFCQYGNESSGFIKGREFLDQLSGYWLLKKDSVPWISYTKNSVELVDSYH